MADDVASPVNRRLAWAAMSFTTLFWLLQITGLLLIQHLHYTPSFIHTMKNFASFGPIIGFILSLASIAKDWSNRNPRFRTPLIIFSLIYSVGFLFFALLQAFPIGD